MNAIWFHTIARFLTHGTSEHGQKECIFCILIGSNTLEYLRAKWNILLVHFAFLNWTFNLPISS